MPAPSLPRAASNPTVDAINAALRLHRAGNSAAAARQLDRVLKNNPGNPVVLSQVGRVLRLCKEADKARTLLLKSIALRPTAEALIELGFACIDSLRAAEAVTHLRAAVELKPDSADAWSALGYAQGKARQLDDAEKSLRRALALKADHAETYNRLGIVMNAQGRPVQAAEFHLKAIELSPHSLPAWSNLGMALEAANRVDEAATAFEKALAIDPKNSAVKYNLGINRLTAGQLRRDVWLKYEFRWVVLRESPQRGFSQPYWRGEPIAGKSILIYAEQGLGDTLQFARYAAAIAALGATVHVEVQPPLKALLVDLPGATSVIAKGDPLPAFDYHCPLLSLPFAMDTRLDTIPEGVPYVHAPTERLESWAQRLGPARRPLRAGIVWRGNPRHTNDANRSMPLETFQALFAMDACEFVSLQIKPSDVESARLGLHPSVSDPTPHILDFGDTAALIAQLDLVIAVDTSVAHLAGAMGKPVWLLLPFAPDWRWMLERSDTPWYPQMRLFRQPVVRDWDSVIARVREELVHAAAANFSRAEIGR